jgi:hypothetical protein
MSRFRKSGSFGHSRFNVITTDPLLLWVFFIQFNFKSVLDESLNKVITGIFFKKKRLLTKGTFTLRKSTYP